MKYIMCARVFPAYHPRAGELTLFRSSILSGRKRHTLRVSLHGRKSGDSVSLREWVDKPYRSKQREFARCTIDVAPVEFDLVPGRPPVPGVALTIDDLARADGFADTADFLAWFKGADVFTGYCIWFRDVEAV